MVDKNRIIKKSSQNPFVLGRQNSAANNRVVQIPRNVDAIILIVKVDLLRQIRVEQPKDGSAEFVRRTPVDRRIVRATKTTACRAIQVPFRQDLLAQVQRQILVVDEALVKRCAQST